MLHFDIDALRAQIRTMDYERGSPDQVAQWREDDEDARANLAIEDMPLETNEAALFDMMLDEGVPPELTTRIVADLLRPGAGQLAA
jgi:hypothetical protein